MNASKFEDFLGLLSSGKLGSMDDLQNYLRPTGERDLLKCTSLLRNFNKDIYDRMIDSFPRSTAPKIKFEEFIDSPDLEAVPRTDGVFRVKGPLQMIYLREWGVDSLSPAKEFQTQFLDRLISYFERGEPDNELDLLSVLLLTDPARAKKKFLDLFEKADKNFDLTQCNDIVETLEERIMLLDPELSASNDLRSLCSEKRQYLKARNLFSSDYYQTAFFYARRSVVAEFDELLKEKPLPGPKWIFHLHATGGMGKTMFVKWLISRHCVPEPRRIPVARLDFDFLHLPIVERYPWLLVLAIAEQLNQQIQGNPFNEYLNDYWHYTTLLRHPKEIPGDDSRANKEDAIERILPHDVDAIIKRVINVIEESSSNKMILVVLDTLERMVLHYKNGLLAFLKRLEQIHDAYPMTRLLLSGRYNLQDRFTEFNTLYKEATIIHELPLFSAQEARSYLNDNRALGNKKIVDAIINKCSEGQNGEEEKGSNPFKLSLIADFYQQQVVKTPEEIASLERTDVEYLINRIITHIQEPAVQWLLRYAVVPRRFTYDIFTEVLAPRLTLALKKKDSIDKPNEKFPKGAEKFEGREIWKYLQKGERLNTEKIWNDLRNYASSQSWISFDSSDENTLQLHSDVVIPMRLLLEAHHPIFKTLHDDAIRYFTEKARAEREPELWARYTCEAIYHIFQANDKEEAARKWRQVLESGRCRKNPGMRQIIAEEITGPDYVKDDSKTPIQRANGEFLIDPADLYEAHIRAIEGAVASLAGRSKNEAKNIWIYIHERLGILQRLDKNEKRYPSPFDIAVLRRLTTRMKKSKTNHQKEIPLLREMISATTSEQMVLSLEILLGDIFSALNSEEALIVYNRVLKVVKADGHTAVKSVDVYWRIGLWHKNRSDYAKAEGIFNRLLPLAKKERKPALEEAALRQLAEINCDQGLYDKGVRLLTEARQIAENDGNDQWMDAFFLGQVQARGLFAPLSALSLIEPFLKTEKALTSRAALTELNGDIHGKIMLFENALTELENAKELWTRAANTIGADRARMLRIELQIFGIGNHRVVDSLLSTWERTGSKTDLDLACQIKLLRVLFEHRNHNRGRARREWTTIMKDDKFRQAPRCSIRILAMGLALDFGDDALIKQFTKELKEVSPVSARLPLLDVFRYAELPFNPPSADRETIVKLIDIESHGQDIVPHGLIRADLLDCCGETELAEQILWNCLRTSTRQKNSFAYREVLLALDRLGRQLHRDHSLYNSDFLQDYAAYPALCAAACIEEAERALKREKIRPAMDSLTKAQEFLTKADSETNQWRARLSELMGDAASKTDDLVSAKRNYNMALSIYKKLGNKPAVDRLEERLPRIDQPDSRNNELLTVRMKATGKSLEVTTDFGDGTAFLQKFVSTPDDRWFRAITAHPGDASGVYEFSETFLANPRGFESKGGELLFSRRKAPKLNRAHRNGPMTDFSLDALTPSLAKIPWEFASLRRRNTASLFRYFYRSITRAGGDTEQIKWLQIALNELLGTRTFVDGVFGPQTLESLKELKRRLKLPENVSTAELNTRIGEELVRGKTSRKTRALLILPRREQQIRSQRGLEAAGPSIDWWYNDCYFAVETLWWSEIDNLKNVVKRFQPDVIHIQSSLRLMHTTGQIYLDFGFESNQWAGPEDFASISTSFQPSAAFVNDALSLLPDSKVRPLVILDAVCPSGATEVVHQLLYRNAFAAELFQLGSVSSILAMGLCENATLRGDILGELIQALSNTRTLGSIVNLLKTFSTSDAVEQRIATLGIALFTNEPSLTLLSPDKL
jgi:hypothetical protein